MKCPKCGWNQRVKLGMTCGGCQYRFVFNPKEARTFGLTDGKFAACIRAASQNDTSYFTPNQLYAVYCRRMSKSPWGSIGCLVISLVAAGFIIYLTVMRDKGDLWVLAAMAVMVAIGSLFSAITAARQKIHQFDFERLLNKWRTQNSIDKLIEQPALHEPPPDWSEPDIYDYGIERLLIVERDILVDLFVKNGLHAEQRMLVISQTGYPDYLVPLARKLLEEQPDLPVFLLHDATKEGVVMEARVRASDQLPLKDRPITDLGMFPHDFKKLKRTSRYDRGNAERELPVDALLLPFMMVGLGAALTEELAFGEIIDEQQRTTVGGGYDFG